MVVTLSAMAALGQATNSGDIRGTVTDATGAVIPGATVTVLDINTGVSKRLVTDSAGLYDTSSIVNGTYKVTFEMPGFKELVRGPVTVLVGFTTVNAQLTVGATSQQVTVTEDVPLLQTETGSQQTTLTADVLQQMPQVGQDWENFTILIPGASGNTANGQGEGANPGQWVSVNGNLPYSNILADGSSTTLPQSTNSDVSIFETVAELQISDSAMSAQYGTGGFVFNQISKSGTNKFHGAAYEYLQNDALNAQGYGFGNTIPVPFLRYNNYGGSIGGPILKNKMFFYFNVDRTADHGSASGYTTVPTTAMLSGDFTGQPTIYDPTTQIITQTPSGPVVTRTSFAQEYGNGNRIPAGMIDSVAQKIAALYPTPASHSSVGEFVPGTVVGGVDTSNYHYSYLTENPFNKYFGRLDYDISPENRLTLSDTQRDNPGEDPYIYTCPVSCQLFDVDSNNAQISDVWNISTSTINEARIGFTAQYSDYTPGSLNDNYPQTLGLQFAKANLFPSISISGNNCCDAPGPTTNADYKQNVFDFSDVVTMIRGRHVLHFGGEFLVQRRDGTGWGNINAASVSFNGSYTQSTVGDSTSGIAFADFLLGQVQSWSAAVTPGYGARMKQPEAFIQDDFKLRPNLTLNLGLRYQASTGVSEVKNNVTTFDPTVMNPVTSSPGALWYATTAANGRKDLIAPQYNILLPRAGFAWLPLHDTTLRGGIGLYAYPYDLDQNGGGLGSAFAARGSLSDQTNGITPVVLLSSSGSQLPYGTPNNNAGAFPGQGINYTDYNSPMSKSLQWNLSAERAFSTNMAVEVAYVGNHGYDLFFPVDLNQVPASELGPNDNPTDRPYPYWGSIFGGKDIGYSNYHSLQASIKKRFTSGLGFDVNYTWAHFLDTQDSGNGGNNVWMEQTMVPSADYGPSQFDIRDAFKGRAVYLLPIGHGQRFLNNNRAVDAVIGGWQASGTLVLSTGNPFTPTINGPNNSYSQAGYWYPNVIGHGTLAQRSIKQWFDPSAFTAPAPGTFGDMRRNSIYGPGLEVVNLSAGKNFAIWEKVALQIRADANNAFNHPSFGLPNSGLTCSNAGAPCMGAANITSVSVGGRTMQLGARLSF
ncbi:MAG: TonB-dependent receptor [Acidobacteriaceae bacterium]